MALFIIARSDVLERNGKARSCDKRVILSASLITRFHKKSARAKSTARKIARERNSVNLLLYPQHCVIYYIYSQIFCKFVIRKESIVFHKSSLFHAVITLLWNFRGILN